MDRVIVPEEQIKKWTSQFHCGIERQLLWDPVLIVVSGVFQELLIRAF